MKIAIFSELANWRRFWSSVVVDSEVFVDASVVSVVSSSSSGTVGRPEEEAIFPRTFVYYI